MVSTVGHRNWLFAGSDTTEKPLPVGFEPGECHLDQGCGREGTGNSGLACARLRRAGLLGVGRLARTTTDGAGCGSMQMSKAAPFIAPLTARGASRRLASARQRRPAHLIYQRAPDHGAAPRQDTPIPPVGAVLRTLVTPLPTRLPCRNLAGAGIPHPPLCPGMKDRAGQSGQMPVSGSRLPVLSISSSPPCKTGPNTCRMASCVVGCTRAGCDAAGENSAGIPEAAQERERPGTVSALRKLRLVTGA